ncbi:30S ribosomal protein S12 methylthiotransferase RimO [Propionimicrobium sp. PCR01-08-3]|uniref:30S ribosomal protein S12 methylthiotransferase RimO n=1 Tax=Propionimicrobium sp. PCR01-08-3 TaxID=3052086 RepID=UPI00255D0DC8|nr:30S ribosomal protein S12 methylthiotransferase RimO [Propionimicrobium sp. PCR01-08-3]WIY83639.1 30S ribosomal protein S12 methylthiotransferase RimO [Propionimicrobium sp. PCR01-08-3]
MTTAVHLVSLGCSRNDVDSEELAARLDAEGFRLVDEPDQAEVIMVNTCGFIEQAKKDSIDTVLAAADQKQTGKAQAVVAVGCMAERYGTELADALPEADAVLGFDSYPQIAAKLRTILAGGHVDSHQPKDRRTLLPLMPVARQQAVHDARAPLAVPGHGEIVDDDLLRASDRRPASGPPVLRKRLHGGPFAPLKIASGCDRRCAFCAIPSFRGAYLSRPASEIVAEANWLAGQGVKEVMLVSENSSSYGKDLGTPRALSNLLTELSVVDGLEWIRVSYLQPAEITPDMLTAIASLPNVVPYFDLSFQHASGPLLRAMRRFGDAEQFLALIDNVRTLAPRAGIRSNFIVGFPGETDEEVEVLADFISQARLDVAGVFSYSPEEGTEGATLPGQVDEDTIDQRHELIAGLIDEVCNQRAADRIGERVRILIEEFDDGQPIGRAAHQGPEVDGITTLIGTDTNQVKVGDFVDAVVTDSVGVDLTAQIVQ